MDFHARPFAPPLAPAQAGNRLLQDFRLGPEAVDDSGSIHAIAFRAEACAVSSVTMVPTFRRKPESILVGADRSGSLCVDRN
jgi:hypothetical protein